ncbi:MAG: SHOCT domain-containing protein [Oscillospiraceae bacterium]
MTVSEAVRMSGSNIFSNASIQEAEKMIFPNEQVIFALCANVEAVSSGTGGLRKSVGVVVVTNTRVLFVSKIANQSTTKQILLSNIQSVGDNATLFSSKARIAGVTEILVAEGQKKPIAALVHCIQQAQANLNAAPAFMPPPQPVVPQFAPVDTDAELRKLKSLLDDGIITSEDFEAKKKQLLGL